MNLKDILKGDNAAITTQTLRDYTYEIPKVAKFFIGVRKKIKNDQTNHISSQKNILDDVF